MWWSGVGEEEAFYNPVIRSQASVSLSPWAVIFTDASQFYFFLLR